MWGAREEKDSAPTLSVSIHAKETGSTRKSCKEAPNPDLGLGAVLVVCAVRSPADQNEDWEAQQ